MKPQAALFDLDGLMLDTERYWSDGLRRAAVEAGWDVPADLFLKTIGINCRVSARIVAEIMGSDFPYWELRERVLAQEKIDFETRGIPQRPGLIPLLDALAAKKIPLAVATSTDRERALWKLRYGGIEGRFAAVVCGDEIENGKPSPDIFLRAASKLGTPPEDCAGFEDSPAGIRALAAAGIRSIFIKDLVEPEPDVLAFVWKRLTRLDEAIDFF